MWKIQSFVSCTHQWFVAHLLVAMLTSLFELAHRSFHSPLRRSDLAGRGVGLHFDSSLRALMTASSSFLALIASNKSSRASSFAAAAQPIGLLSSRAAEARINGRCPGREERMSHLVSRRARGTGSSQQTRLERRSVSSKVLQLQRNITGQPLCLER